MSFFARTLLLGLVLASLSWADSLQEGSTVPVFSLEDQHGRSRSVDESVRVIISSKDMNAGDIIKQALEENGEQMLEQSSAVYIADVSGMPWFVRQFIAEPRMRERPYPMLLDRDGSVTETFPHAEGKPTLIILDKGKIVRIVHVESPAELKEGLKALP